MELTHHKTNDIDIIALSGRFDALQVPKFVGWLNTNSTASKVIVNLKNVDFIDSSGLSTLVKGLKRCRQAGGDFYLSELPEAVFIIFELTRLDKAFTIYDSDQAAINAMVSS